MFGLNSAKIRRRERKAALAVFELLGAVQKECELCLIDGTLSARQCEQAELEGSMHSWEETAPVLEV